MEFKEFGKIPRLSRPCVVTEKIDGTNACIYITEDMEMHVGSRTRWITPEQDNYGFAAWARAHEQELLTLGPGRHFGEWWGPGINRGYGQREKRFSLFNITLWEDDERRPPCCYVVPVLYRGEFDTRIIDDLVGDLQHYGSRASPGFMRPEGVIVYHEAARLYFKKTCERDEAPKGKANA